MKNGWFVFFLFFIMSLSYCQPPNMTEDQKLVKEASKLINEAHDTKKDYAKAYLMFKKAVKINPQNKDAQTWVEQLELIYRSQNKPIPKEEEPTSPN